MCTIAGYIGERQAAPVLLEMLRREEGLDSGFYTGIATIHEGKIYYAKVIGDTDRLEALKRVSAFPGNIGFIHSRTKSGGGVEYGHPFIGFSSEGVAETAFVANGTAGIFSADRQKKAALAEELLSEGFTLRSKAEGVSGGYPTLSDGAMVHESDIHCQLAYRNILKGDAPEDALVKAYYDCRSEDVGLLLTLTQPDKIFFIRNNMPMHFAKGSHGVYLATAPLAFPDDVSEHTLLPVNTCGSVSKHGFTVKPFAPLARFAPVTATARSEAYNTVIKMLSEGGKTHPQLRRAILPLFKDYDSNQAAAIIYDIEYSLYREKKIRIENIRVEGVEDGVTAPQSIITLTENKNA